MTNGGTETASVSSARPAIASHYRPCKHMCVVVAVTMIVVVVVVVVVVVYWWLAFIPSRNLDVVSSRGNNLVFGLMLL